MGFEHLLLVTGEHQAKVGRITFVVISLPCVNSSLHYRWSATAGGGGICRVKTAWPRWRMVYQETYHEATYAHHHLKGKNRTSSGGWKRRIG